jgi:hypothetical protein
MEDDPKGIISLLELSACERDKWVIVAAHYRRSRNPIAAINVLSSMMKGDPPLSPTLVGVVAFQELMPIPTRI